MANRYGEHLYEAARQVAQWPKDLQGLLGPPPEPIFRDTDRELAFLLKLEECERRLEEIERELEDDEPSRWEMMAR